MPKRGNSGLVLFIVIGIIMIVVILSTAILRVVSNHSRLNYHQVSRIQAQYAAKAGVLYALDKLRRNDDLTCWPATGTYTNRMVSSGATGCDFNEAALSTSIQEVDITVGVPGSGISGTRKVTAKAVLAVPPS
jgi:Tfp pilus assembly protein PilX